MGNAPSVAPPPDPPPLDVPRAPAEEREATAATLWQRMLEHAAARAEIEAKRFLLRAS